MHSCFYESKNFFGCLMKKKEKKIEDGEYPFLKALAKHQEVAHGRPSITWIS